VTGFRLPEISHIGGTPDHHFDDLFFFSGLRSCAFRLTLPSRNTVSLSQISRTSSSLCEDEDQADVSLFQFI
jgi:hypothetical protein